ncbi:hypothetical protein [Micromonospora coerulea]|uniref:hypothetical protein n=1 Tax=Micromonospora coerulea TaxID=47856 RepID=UPI001905DACA|nr:hypothetical protein [Micromonospora veneta]
MPDALDLSDSELIERAADLLYEAADPRATPWPDPMTLGRLRSRLRGLADHLASGHTLIRATELTAALAKLTPCADCAGGLGVHVEPDGEWTAVVLHSVPCPVTATDTPVTS